ncbi:Werner syndrome ATP-dependent helicase-like protein [Bienertia sinuspersici]
MSHGRQVSTIRKRTRDDNRDGTEDEMELIAIVSGFIMVVVGAGSDRFKHKDLPWNEHECAIERAYWLDSPMNDKICKEQLRIDTVMNNKHKEPMASTQDIKRGYVSWNKQMDDILTWVLLEEINNKEKRDRDFKPQAYQAVVDELKKELGIAINVDRVRNRTKSWKKHYGYIMDIRTYTKFKWDDEKKMIVITMEDLPQWTEYIKVCNMEKV